MPSIELTDQEYNNVRLGLWSVRGVEGEICVVQDSPGCEQVEAALSQLVLDGLVEMSGVNENGEMTYSVTSEGEAYMENMKLEEG